MPTAAPDFALSRIRLPAEAERATQAVAAAVAQMGNPGLSSLEAARFSKLCALLALQDGTTAAELLDLPHDRPEGAYGQLACYAVTVLILAAFAKQQLATRGRERLQRIIRQQIRVELARQWFRAATTWLIPATPEERTAAHVAALLLSRAGIASRPWLWVGVPEHGCFSLLGPPGGGVLETGSHPAMGHHRCTGNTDFARLV